MVYEVYSMKRRILVCKNVVTMRYLKIYSCFYYLLSFLSSNAQQPTIQLLASGKKVSLRGLSVVSDNIIWASGSNGSVARSVDGGNTFTWLPVIGYEKTDFRDIEAFDKNTAIIMGITEPAILLKTTDGGKIWRKIFEDTTKGAFFDAMDFSIDDNKDITGIVIGDPIKGKIYYAISFNGGDSWQAPEDVGKIIPTVTDGEAFFASSGTNISLVNDAGFKPFLYAVSGGKSSNLWDLYYWKKYPLPIVQGQESTGANSLARTLDKKHGIVVGGDFKNDTISKNNSLLISFEPEITFSIPQTPPHGYRSCVIYMNKKNLLTCGTSGIDISKDGGMNWELISKESYHVCQKAKKGKAIFLAGGNGRIAKLVIP